MIVDCGHYRDGVRRHEGTLDLAEAAACRARGDGFVWVGLLDPTPDELKDLAGMFDLHELAVEDAAHEHQRPKIETYDEHFFVVLRTARYLDDVERVDFGEVHLFLGSGFALTIRHGDASALGAVRHRLEGRPDLLSHGPIAVLWGVLDRVVDDYVPVVQGIEQDIEQVEQQVFGEAAADPPTARVYFLKREVTQFFRAVNPLLVPLDTVERGANDQVEPMREYFRDVNDHAKLVHEDIIAMRDQLQTVLDASIALVGHAQNAVVRTISAWAAIITVPTLIASVYGMNFRHMPELMLRFGYPAALVLMLSTAIGLYAYFRRVRWL